MSSEEELWLLTKMVQLRDIICILVQEMAKSKGFTLLFVRGMESKAEVKIGLM